MKNKSILIIGIITLLLVVSCLSYFFIFDKKDDEYDNTKMNIVLSLEDKIANDSAWCGTFNLIWNDLKNELAKQDIVFKPQLDIVTNLNKGTFTTNELDDDSYYKIYGHPTTQLKKVIEKAIKDKFDETSEILEAFNWDDNSTDYMLYTMLKKVFEFPYAFTELENDNFGEYEDVKFFGIKQLDDSELKEQVDVLYYNDNNNYAVKLLTKTNDEVILARGLKNNNFLEAYNTINEYANDYRGKNNFTENDSLKVPNIKFKLKEEFTDLENKPFNFADGEEYIIEKAIQTIEFELDKTGGKIKSEAGIGVKNTSIQGETILHRNFNFDDTFMIFLKETNRALPYFSAQISQIKELQ